jgi:EAL domain-containing protein (putative c-di-GMP-specific phosphodiesterase class I)
MYAAKKAAGGLHQVVDLREQHLADSQVRLENDVPGLLSRRELYLDYQPIVETADGRLNGVEGLLRWKHPSRGVVPPDVLIPLAEEFGLIVAIGRWVLLQASIDQVRWQHQFRVDDVGMSINVSTLQLMAPGFADTVAEVLADRVTKPGMLTLEMTESVFVRDAERALTVLHDLKDLGVKVALDDFGAGYSSLSYLLRFPVDIIKMDGVFVAGLGHDPANELLVAAVIGLAHGLGLTVVAEGGETAEQHRALTRLGCDACQGFYFARPMAAAALDILIDHHFNGATPPSTPSRPALRSNTD